MEHVVLGLLVLRNLTLYELNQAFKQGISMFYSASYGSLQIAVKNLLAKEWVVFTEQVDKGRNKKVYSITEQGKEAFFQWMFFETPTNKLEVAALSKVFFLGLIPDVEQQKQILQEIIDKIQQAELDMNQLNTEISQVEVPASYQGVLKYQLKTLDYGLNAHACAREWFLALLKEIDSREPPSPAHCN